MNTTSVAPAGLYFIAHTKTACPLGFPLTPRFPHTHIFSLLIERTRERQSATICNTKSKPSCCNQHSKSQMKNKMQRYSCLLEAHSVSPCCISLLQNSLCIDSNIMMVVHQCKSTQSLLGHCIPQTRLPAP